MSRVALTTLMCCCAAALLLGFAATGQRPARAESEPLPATQPAATQPQAAPSRASAPLISGFTEFHGREGFWRIAKSHDGVWWFVGPQNRPEFLNMVTTVQPVVHGRDANGPDYLSRDWDAQAKDGMEAWARATLKRIQDIGFKGIGAWSEPVFHQLDVPMSQDLNISTWTRNECRLMLSPAWAPAAEAAIRSQTARLADNRNLVGYYLDNEINWDDDAAGPATYFDGLAPTDPNRREVVSTIQATWPSLDLFNRDWNTKLADWKAIDQWQLLPHEPALAYDRLSGQWLSRLAGIYFKSTTHLIHKYDPNHLILGIRYRGAAPAEVVRASRGCTDAQSLNYYVNDAKLDADTFSMLSRESQQPIIISEYSFHSLDGRSGDRNTVGFDAQVLDQQARADAYHLFTTRLARLPYVIGADWFQWMDEPPSGRLTDGEDANFGVVDVDDRRYEPLADAIRTTTPLLNPLHDASANDPHEDVWREGFGNHPVARVPFLTRPIRLNGELSDWEPSCRVPNVHACGAVGTERARFPEPNVYLGWNNTGLYMAMEVFDNDVSAAPATGWWWARDNVEFWLSTRPVRSDQTGYDAYCHHFFYVPVDFPAQDGVSGVVGQWHSPGDGLKDNIIPHPDIRQVTRILPDRYVVEMFIPARALRGFDPVHQPVLAFNINVKNFQHAQEYFWSAPKQALTQARPNTWGTIVLEPPAGNAPQIAGVETGSALSPK